MVGNVKLGILDAWICKNIYVKEKLAKHFSWETGFTQVFVKTLTTLGFRYRVISDKFLVFGVKILPQKMYLLFLILLKIMLNL